MKNKAFLIILLLFLWGCNEKTYSEETEECIHNTTINEDIVSVTEAGIKNDGSPIGPELNNLVKESYKKTLFFPAGTYNLTEPILLPLDYTKNVNIIFDKNALIKCDNRLEALLKIGYSERYIVDRTLRQFSYVEGGIFDCYNADNGIMVNGLKQLVSLRTISLIKGRKTHIRINVTDDFNGTGSSDTKIDNITIQGMSSNDESSVGIYIDGSCHDCKISDTFIYGTRQAIVTKSAGHIINNLHILSKMSTGSTSLGENNYRKTEGIRVEAGGFFVFNQIYYDTVDKGIVVGDNISPTLLLDQNISFSYLDNFGTSFIYRENSSNKPLEVKLSNSIFTIRNKDFTIFDTNRPMIGWDVKESFTFINCTIHNPHSLNPYDPALLQRLRKTTSDAIIYTNLSQYDADWHVLGALITSPYRSVLNIDMNDNFNIELDLKFSGGDALQINNTEIFNQNNEDFDLGYAVKGDYCVLLFKPKKGGNYYPIITDKQGSGSFMPPPSKDKNYKLSDYGISEDQVTIIQYKD